MNDSNFYYELARSLYYYQNSPKKILKSKTYALANLMRILVRQPVIFMKRGVKLMFANPKKMLKILTGRFLPTTVKTDELINEYNTWITEVEAKRYNLSEQKLLSKKLKDKPLISLITPVFNPPKDAFIKLIDSVLKQTYGNLELILGDFGNDPEITAIIKKYEKKDPRVKGLYNLPNKGISGNSNICLEYAKGEFVALLDHDDALMPYALFVCVEAINNDLNIDFIYTDKDKISEDDIRSEPLFKPDWSPEMAMSCNYMTHFNLMRTSLLKEVGAWDSETDGAQDWDLFLRMSEKARKIQHVPHITYHWRTVTGSTSNSLSVKPYARDAQVLAIKKFIDRNSLSARPFHDGPGQLYIEWKEKNTDISFFIHTTYKDIGGANKIVNNIYKELGYRPKADSILVFICSNDYSSDDIEAFNFDESEATIIKYRRGEYIKTVKQQSSKIKNSKIFFVSDSVVSTETRNTQNSWIDQLLGWTTIKNVNIAGGLVVAHNGQVIDAGSFYDPLSKTFSKYCFSAGFRSGYNGHLEWIRNHIMTSERLFVVDKKIITGLEENLINARDDEFFNVLSLSNYKSNGRAVYDPGVLTVDNASFHITLESSSVVKEYSDKHFPQLKSGDPYYNVNLNSSYNDPKPKQNTPITVEHIRTSRLQTLDKL